MKQSIFALMALTIVSCSSAPEASAKDSSKSWACMVEGKTTADRWAAISKAAPTMLGMSRADVEKALGKGTYSETQDELMYLISGDGSKGVFDNITVSFGKNGKVKSFVIVTKAKD